MICATLCVYQVCQLLNQYFEYDVEAQTTIHTIERMSFPTISICVYYDFYGNGSVPREIRNIFKHSAYDYDHRILSCELVLKNGDKVNCKSVTKSEKIMNFDYVCHSLFTENKELLQDYHSNIFLSVDLNLTDTGDEELLLALYNQNQVDINCDSIGIDYLYNHKHDVTSYSYTENSFHLLPSPFKSMCVDYNSMYNNSRRAIVERCAQRRFYNSSDSDCEYGRKCLSGGSFISEKDVEYHLNYTIPDVHFHESYAAPAFERKFCNNQLKARECQTREFAIRRSGTTKSYEVRKQNIHRLLFFRPKLAGLDVQEFQLLSFEEALSAIAGILNLWSNMAIMDITNLILPIVFAFVGRAFTKRGRVVNVVQVEVRPKVRQLKPHAKIRSLRKLSSKRASRIVIAIVYCIVSLLCCGHIYHICNLYIEHPFQTEVRLLKKPTFTLKPLSICAALDTSSNSALKKTFDYYVNQAKFVKTFSGQIRTTNTTRYVVRAVSSVITSLRKSQVCFTLFLGLPKNIIRFKPEEIDLFKETLTGELNKATLQDTYFIHMIIKLEYFPNGIDIVLHNHGTDLDTSLDNGNKLTYRRPMNRKIRYYLTYLTYEKSLIPDHYKSNCLDYKRQDFNDRDDAIRQCALKSFVKQHHQIPSNYLVSESETNLINMTFSHFNYNNELKNCRMMYKNLDCFSSEIKLLQRYYYVTDDHFRQIQLILMTPQAYNYYTSQTFRNSFLEFFGNIGGTVALWIGCSFYDLHRIVKLIINRFRRNLVR